MELQLHRIDFYFTQNHCNYKVVSIALEDDTYVVYIYLVLNAGNDARCIGSFDIKKEPTSADAKEFLIKTLA